MESSVALFYTILALVLLRMLNFHWRRRRLYHSAAKIKGPISLPFVGSAYLFRKGENELFNRFVELGARYKPTGKFWIFSDLYVMVTRPEDVQKVLRECVGKGQLYRFFTYGTGYGLITAPVPIWEVHRKIINQTFSQKILNAFVATFVERSKELVADLRSTDYPVETFPMFAECFYRIISETCMEVVPVDSKKQAELFALLSRNIKIVFSRLMNPLLHNDIMWKLFGRWREEQAFIEKGLQIVTEVITKKGKELEDHPGGDSSRFLGQLIKMRQEGKLSPGDVIEETQTMYLAGTETSATTMSFILLMLAMHQEVQELVYQEMLMILGPTNRDTLPEDLNKMEYTERVVKETMRLFPVVPLLIRHADRDLVLEDSTVVPKGANVWIPVGYIHRDPEIWSEPLRFDPDRFLESQGHRCSYLPFSLPPRNCIGMKFSMMAIKVMLCEILRNFRIVSCQYKSIEDIELTILILLRATDGYRITFKPRS